MSRTLVEPRKSGLTAIAVFGAVFVCLWLWLAYAALMAGQLSYWVILPISLVGAMLSLWVCVWASQRRASEEPAMILDEVGVYDNVSMALAGRLKWHEVDHIWIAGPSWMEFLCILPNDVRRYMGDRDDVKALVMRLNNVLMGAPIVIPMSALEIASDDLTQRIDEVSGATRSLRTSHPQPPPSVSAAHK